MRNVCSWPGTCDPSRAHCNICLRNLGFLYLVVYVRQRLKAGVQFLQKLSITLCFMLIWSNVSAKTVLSDLRARLTHHTANLPVILIMVSVIVNLGICSDSEGITNGPSRSSSESLLSAS